MQCFFGSVAEQGGGVRTYTDANANSARTLNGAWQIGNDSAVGNREFDGVIYAAGIWSRAVSAPETTMLLHEPYAFLRPVINRRYSVPSGAAPTVTPLPRRRAISWGVGRGIMEPVG